MSLIRKDKKLILENLSTRKKSTNMTSNYLHYINIQTINNEKKEIQDSSNNSSKKNSLNTSQFSFYTIKRDYKYQRKKQKTSISNSLYSSSTYSNISLYSSHSYQSHSYKKKVFFQTVIDDSDSKEKEEYLNPKDIGLNSSDEDKDNSSESNHNNSMEEIYSNEIEKILIEIYNRNINYICNKNSNKTYKNLINKLSEYEKQIKTILKEQNLKACLQILKCLAKKIGELIKKYKEKVFEIEEIRRFKEIIGNNPIDISLIHNKKLKNKIDKKLLSNVFITLFREMCNIKKTLYISSEQIKNIFKYPFLKIKKDITYLNLTLSRMQISEFNKIFLNDKFIGNILKLFVNKENKFKEIDIFGKYLKELLGKNNENLETCDNSSSDLDKFNYYLFYKLKDNLKDENKNKFNNNNYHKEILDSINNNFKEIFELDKAIIYSQDLSNNTNNISNFNNNEDKSNKKDNNINNNINNNIDNKPIITNNKNNITDREVFEDEKFNYPIIYSNNLFNSKKLLDKNNSILIKKQKDDLIKYLNNFIDLESNRGQDSKNLNNKVNSPIKNPNNNTMIKKKLKENIIEDTKKNLSKLKEISISNNNEEIEKLEEDFLVNKNNKNNKSFKNLDDLVNYINDETDIKKKKKKNKKKKKFNNNNIIYENNNENINTEISKNDSNNKKKVNEKENNNINNYNNTNMVNNISNNSNDDKDNFESAFLKFKEDINFNSVYSYNIGKIKPKLSIKFIENLKINYS